jgi:hypothetical protein
MRDGVLLHTLVDFPPFYDGKPKTVVVDASPYGQNELEELADIWLLFDMIGVRQDVRGTKKSGGTFSLWHQTANDSVGARAREGRWRSRPGRQDKTRAICDSRPDAPARSLTPTRGFSRKTSPTATFTRLEQAPTA